MNFRQKLDAITTQNNSLLCVGLDPDIDKLPKHLLKVNDPIFEFNKEIIDSTHDLVCTYKPNSAFYEAHGIKGHQALKKTIDYIHDRYTGIPVILDAKRGDIGDTAKMYAKAAFENLQADALTVHPNLGLDSLLPFLEYKDKLTIVLIKTSNPDSGMFQNLPTYSSSEEQSNESRSNSSRQARTIPYYLAMSEIVTKWNFDNLGIFVGATYPEELIRIRRIFSNKIFLSAGFGAQKGAIEEAVKAGIDKDEKGIMFSASRSIIYAGSEKDFAQKARQEAERIRDEINTFRN